MQTIFVKTGRQGIEECIYCGFPCKGKHGLRIHESRCKIKEYLLQPVKFIRWHEVEKYEHEDVFVPHKVIFTSDVSKRHLLPEEIGTFQLERIVVK